MTISYPAAADVDKPGEFPITQHNVGQAIIPMDESIASQVAFALLKKFIGLLCRLRPHPFRKERHIKPPLEKSLFCLSKVDSRSIRHGTSGNIHFVQPS